MRPITPRQGFVALVIISTISKAMSETVATKADLELQSAVTKADNEALRTELKLIRQHVESRFDKVDLRFDVLEQSLLQEMAALENRLVLKLGGLMVAMTFLLLAIGPFYIRWVMSLMGT